MPVMPTARIGRHPPRGPDERALRRYLRHHRRRLPRVLRASLAAGFAAFAGYGLILAAVRTTDPALFGVLAPFLALVIIGGREPAMLLAYQALSPDALPWVAGVAVLGDVGVILLGVPLYWWALERLRAVPLVRGVLLGLERRAFERRRLIDRWGPFGLALLVAVPAWGTGVLVAGAVGLIARLALPRLLLVLVVAAALVNVAWAVLLAHAAGAIPDAGTWRYLPAALLGLVLAGAVTSTVRDTRRGEVVLPLDHSGHLEAGHREALRRVGITDFDGLIRVDCGTLRDQLGLPRGHVERCRAVMELLLLNRVAPTEAAALTEVGVQGVRDLAVAPPVLVARALAESGALAQPVAHLTERAEAWHADAEAFTALPGGG